MNGTLSAVVTLVLPKVVNVIINDDTLSVDLEDGRTISVPIGWYPRLVYATPVERANVQISSAGYGIHWPDLDEDIGVEGLLFGKKSTAKVPRPSSDGYKNESSAIPKLPHNMRIHPTGFASLRPVANDLRPLRGMAAQRPVGAHAPVAPR